jgi:hypothetical protein
MRSVDVKKMGCWRCKLTQWSDCSVRLWNACRSGKPFLRFGNSSACPSTQNAVRPVSPLLWCLGVRGHEHTGTLRDIEELECTVEVSWQKYCSKLMLCYWGLVVSLAAMWCVTAEVFGVRLHCPAK